ncbi:ZZ-type zinc finger-containing protein 3-like isoform X2 [Homarus americanus]|uniref:ZZ-type zinc finger-containing protein 3-like isoform X2 n=1 Tax=Homarus americanus TaxID=6706 RepID=UPI001C441EAE|nr:ZZ-type zinc finger-containing protein 3-like isoform X2 [Homarus americanus]
MVLSTDRFLSSCYLNLLQCWSSLAFNSLTLCASQRSLADCSKSSQLVQQYSKKNCSQVSGVLASSTLNCDPRPLVSGRPPARVLSMVEEGSVNIEDLPPLADIDEEVGEYFFESDPLALKDNPDYQQLIKAMVKLQAQRAKAVKDMERLQEAREEALQDPLGFVTSLQNGDSLNLPGPQEIIQIPHIDWEKYNVKSITQGMRPKTRKRVLQENLTAQQPVQESKDPVTDDGKIMVRGRLYDGSKPQTFNQSWTDEEQRKYTNTTSSSK